MKPMVKRVILLICCLFMGLTFSSCKKKESCPMLWPFSVNASFKKTIYNLNEEDILFDIGFGIDSHSIIDDDGWYELRATTYTQYNNPREYFFTSNSKVILTIENAEACKYQIIHLDSQNVEYGFNDTLSIPKDIFDQEEGYLAISFVSVYTDEDDPLLFYFPFQVYNEFQYVLEDNQLSISYFG